MRNWQNSAMGCGMSKRSKAARTRAGREKIIHAATLDRRAQHSALPGEEGAGVRVQLRAGQNPRRYTAPDTLQRLSEQRLITATQLWAGRQFEEDCYRANVEALRAIPMDRIRSDCGADYDQAYTINAARRRVYGAIYSMGGPSELPAQVTWQVLACQQSLRKISERLEAANSQMCKGLIISGLVHLTVFYAGRRPKKD